jgi:hypothetical protein
MCNYIRYLRDKKPLTKEWFRKWLKNQPELHVIKSKPITRNRVEIHSIEVLENWSRKELGFAIMEYGFEGLAKAIAVKRIHNIDEKGCRLVYPAGQDIVVLVDIEEIYIGIPENRLSVTVIETIRADSAPITPLVVILPARKTMEHWFYKNMTRYELIQLSDSGYTNKDINIAWLRHFIAFNNCGPNEPWYLLVLDGASSHHNQDFIEVAKINHMSSETCNV